VMNDLYEPLAIILINYGEIQRINPIRVASVFEDQKVRITGLIDGDSMRRFVRFVVHIKMSSGEPDQERVITDSLLSDLPVTSPKDDTIVYSAKVEYGDFSGYTIAEYYRPGRWLSYIMQLRARIHEQAERERQLNHTRIDDSALFADLSDPQ
jgi:hypothetical protein